MMHRYAIYTPAYSLFITDHAQYIQDEDIILKENTHYSYQENTHIDMYDTPNYLQLR